jgi:hypothetical protein
MFAGGRSTCLAVLSSLFLSKAAGAEITLWTLGGSELEWSANDTANILIDFATLPGTIQPVYLTPDRSIFSHYANWSSERVPRELGYVDGERPRAWRGDTGNVTEGFYGELLVDGDSTTYNTATSAYGVLEWYTIDLAVPVPAHRFGFYTPSTGFRADGGPLREDVVPAYEVSIAPDGGAPSLSEGDAPIGAVIASVRENFAANVQIEFPRQYVRYVRYKRQESLQDLQSGALGFDFTGVAEESFLTGTAATGTVGDFELFGQGVPRQAIYKTKILDLGREVNFGRLFWQATPMRMVGGKAVAAADAAAWIQVEARSGRDVDPVIYHEFTAKGGETVVSRQRYELELKPPDAGQPGKPGLRASLAYDIENWTFWSLPILESGQPIGLQNGSFLQLKITLGSESFDDFIRLDSLWIEQSPLLVRRVVGEVARLDDPLPERGFTQVALGEMTELTYDIRAEFGQAQPGFDAVRILTDNRVQFRRLEMGEDRTGVAPLRVVERDNSLEVILPQKVVQDRNLPIRIVFGAQVFLLASTFAGEVYDTASQDLPQPIEAGNSNDQVSTNSLRVLARATGSMVQDLVLSQPLITPNADGVNDALEIGYSLFHLPQSVSVTLKVYDLQGRLVARLDMGKQGAGPQRLRWDGRNREGHILAPGLYLIEVVPQTEFSDSRQLRLVGIAY